MFAFLWKPAFPSSSGRMGLSTALLGADAARLVKAKNRNSVLSQSYFKKSARIIWGEEFLYLLNQIWYLFIYLFIYKSTPAAYRSFWDLGSNQRCICKLRCSLWQHRILNPLSKVRDWTRVLMETVGFLTLWATTGTPRYDDLFWFIFMLFFQSCTPWHMEVPRLGVKSEL